MGTEHWDQALVGAAGVGASETQGQDVPAPTPSPEKRLKVQQESGAAECQGTVCSVMHLEPPGDGCVRVGVGRGQRAQQQLTLLSVDFSQPTLKAPVSRLSLNFSFLALGWESCKAGFSFNVLQWSYLHCSSLERITRRVPV